MTNLPKMSSPVTHEGHWSVRLAPAGVVLACAAAQCFGQGTLTVNFDTGYGVPPPGYRVPTAAYSESGVGFWNPYGLENLVLAGAGVTGCPDNGTAYLAVSQHARLAFRFTSMAPFDLLSFDVAQYYVSVPGPGTLHLVGYTTPDLFGAVTMDLAVGTLPQFQTFTFDSQWRHLYRVDILNDHFSLDNVVLGVPEPSGSTLLAMGSLSGLGYGWYRRKRLGWR